MTAAAPKAETARKAPGVIEAGSAYTLGEFAARAGLGKWALRSARRQGLPVRKALGRSFVVGADFIEWLKSQEGGS